MQDETNATLPHYADDDAQDHSFGLKDGLLDAIRAAIAAENAALIVTLIEPLHAADVAELLSDMREDERAAVVHALQELLDPEILAELTPELQDEIIEALGPQKSAEAIAQLDTDDALYVIEGLEEENQREVLAAMSNEDQSELREGLAFPESSAGRLMQTEFVSVPEFWNVGDTIDYLRRAEDLPSDFYSVVVVDPRYKPMGSVLLSRIMQNKRDTPVRDIMNTDIKRIPTEMDQEQVAHLFRKYGLVEAPVVEQNSGRLVGIVTVDDVVDVIAEEDKEDFEKIGGLEALDDPYLNTPILTLVKKRARWLVILFLGEMLTASAMGYFEGAIAKAVVLALFIPLIISSGGNSGSQAATLVIRAMALGEVKLKDWWRVMRRELFSGLVLGLILGLIGVIRIAVWQKAFGMYGEQWQWVAITVGVALVGVVLWGTLMGAMLPFILRRLGADPATSSTPFVATLVDVTGLIIYFSIASCLMIN